MELIDIGAERDRIQYVYQQHLANIASAEDLVDESELVGVVRGKVRSEDAVLPTPPSQQPARCARRVNSHSILSFENQLWRARGATISEESF